jgi:DNA polymerase III delta prime subunit
MEQYVKTTRFIILCNYVSKIIDPLHSRCMKFEFSAVADGDHRKHLQKIITTEGVKIDDGGIGVRETISTQCSGLPLNRYTPTINRNDRIIYSVCS